jgi:chorismate mutase/prephenate dehydratase
MNDPSSLAGIRAAIDAIDRDILDLLNRRAACSLQAAAVKNPTGEPVFRPLREKELMDRLLKANPGPLPPEHLRAVYREILASSKALQRPQRIAYLGPEGTFSHLAALAFFGAAPEYVPLSCLEKVFESVAGDDCSLGVVPLENSLYGSVGRSMDLFTVHDLFIQAEWYSRIRHSLLSGEHDITAVRTVYSHAQALGQCGVWLREHLPRAGLVSLESTAAAARRAVDEAGAAAIGHEGIAAGLGLEVLARNIEDTPDNWTRFCAVGPVAGEWSGADKTTLLFSVTDSPGSLNRVLHCFAEAGINLVKLESRPMRGECWKYIFFVDLACDPLESRAHAALEAARRHCHSLRILGAYAAGSQTHAAYAAS